MYVLQHATYISPVLSLAKKKIEKKIFQQKKKKLSQKKIKKKKKLKKNKFGQIKIWVKIFFG